VAEGKYVIKIYDRRTLKVRRFVGPYRTKALALKFAREYAVKHPEDGVGVLG